MDAKTLPTLEAPTHPFRRLRPPLKLPRSPSDETQEDKKRKLSKRRRPLPDKKWRKPASHEVEVLGGGGGTSINLSEVHGAIADSLCSLPLLSNRSMKNYR